MEEDSSDPHQMSPPSPAVVADAASAAGPLQSTVDRRGVDNIAFVSAEDTSQDTTSHHLGIARCGGRVWLRGRCEPPRSKVVYSIGVFYCDTEQCKGDAAASTMTSPRRPRRGGGPEALPDILQHSQLPPPYPGRRLPPPAHPPPPPPRPFRGASSEADDPPKHCCGVMVTQTVSIRWFIVMIAFVGLCCAIVGTVLGALKATGREHLTVSLLMIGVGIVLITVSGIAWRLTSHDAPSCRAMLGLHTSEQEPNRRFVPRVPPYGRPHHPYAAMMYPEFQYRPPPPSYQASMQEYRLRLLLLDRQQGSSNASGAPAAAGALSPVSPPPTYRSSHTTLHSRTPLTLTEREYSRPPSYRSRASSAGVLRPSTETLCSTPTAGAAPPQPASHSRNPSLSLSFLSHESLFLDSGHSGRPQQHFTSPESVTAAGLSGDDDSSSPPAARWPAWKSNAVTIVQTTDSSQVLTSRPAGEVRILAHV